MITAAITMIDGTRFNDVVFNDVSDIEQLRTWLNESQPFLNVGGSVIINTQQIIRIKALTNVK